LTVTINRPFVDIPAIQNVTEGSSLQLTAVDTAGDALQGTGLSWKIKPSIFAGVNVNPLLLASVEKDMVVDVDGGGMFGYGQHPYFGEGSRGFSRRTAGWLYPYVFASRDFGSAQCRRQSVCDGIEVVGAEGCGRGYGYCLPMGKMERPRVLF
jgi:hypothetical protein